MSYPTPPSGYPATYAPAVAQTLTPGTVTAARVVAWIQTGIICLIALFFLIVAIFLKSATSGSDGDVNFVGNLASGVLLIFVLILLIFAGAIAVPLIMLKAGRPVPRIVLFVFEGIYVALAVLILTNSDGSVVWPLFMLAASVAVIMLLTTPSARAWSKGLPAPSGQPYPPQQYPAQQHPPQQHLPQQYPAQQYPGQSYAPSTYTDPAYPQQPSGQDEWRAPE